MTETGLNSCFRLIFSMHDRLIAFRTFGTNVNLCFSAPSNCLQYHTGTSGRIQTFNWPATGTTAGTAEGHLQNQK